MSKMSNMSKTCRSIRMSMELKDLMKDNNFETNKFVIDYVDEYMRYLKASMLGPPDSPYEGGVFQIYISLPKEYPFVPPKVKFQTKIWHPNVGSDNGSVIDGKEFNVLWFPGTLIRDLFFHIYSFLYWPNWDLTVDQMVSQQFHTDFLDYWRTAKYWTYLYAMDEKSKELIEGEFKELDAKVESCIEKGVSRDKAVLIVSKQLEYET